MNIFSKVSAWTLCSTIIVNLVACGGGPVSEESGSNSQHPDFFSGPLSLTSSELSSLPLKSVLLIQVERPACRFGEPAGTINHHVCTGTVISDRHVLTAAHCFVSDCPTSNGMVPVQLSGVKIPANPTATMTSFNWDEESTVIRPRNIAVKSGTDGFTGVTYRFKACTATTTSNTSTCKNDQSTYYYTNTSNDVAVLDFGAGILLKAGYPPAPISNSATKSNFDYHRNAFIPVGYSVQDSRELILKPRQARKAWISSAQASSSGSSRWAFSAPAYVNNVYDVGCWGDSGGPAFFDGKIVGIASTIGRSPLNNTSDCSSRLIANESANITYVGLLPSDIASLQTKANGANTTGTIRLLTETGKDLDLWARLRQPSDIDQALSGSERALHFIASSSGVFTTSGGLSNGSSAWTLLTTANSQTIGGTVKQTAASNLSRTATWNVTGLTPGYYRLEILYPRRSDNASCVLVQTKSTYDNIFIARPTRLNQQLGTNIASQTTTFSNTKTNVTPFNGSNSKSYIWVDPAANSKTGTLSVRLSDAGCSSGRMVADTVVLTYISGNK